MPTYFEDLTVGDTAEYGSYDVTEAELLEFAGNYDPQPIPTPKPPRTPSTAGLSPRAGTPAR